MKHLAVYTTIINGYDKLRRPKTPGNADFICFTNKEIPARAPWQLRIEPLPHPDIRYATRYYFDQSTRVLPEYEYTILHSGNSILQVDPESLLKYLEDTDIASFKHRRRDVFLELAMIRRTGRDISELACEQVKRYRRKGFSGKPLSACTLLIRRNTPAIQEFEKHWWEEVKNGSHRDQLSFDYVRWKLGIPITYIPGDVFHTPIMKRQKHEYVYYEESMPDRLR